MMTTTSAPKLEWTEYIGTNGNTQWAADAMVRQGDKVSMTWKIAPVVLNNLLYYSIQDSTLGLIWEDKAGIWKAGFETPETAKEYCQAREDESWAAANPPREYTDTEILDAIDEHGLLFIGVEPGRIVETWTMFTFPTVRYRGTDHREAVTAYLRANPPATPAEPASEPTVGGEMTLREFEDFCKKYSVRLVCNMEKANIFNLWPKGEVTSRLDACGGSIAEVATKFLAAIGARKPPATQPEPAR